MLQRTSVRVVRRAFVSTAIPLAPVGYRQFSTHDRTPSENGFAQKLRELPVVTGQTRPVTKEGDWVCSHRLTERMEVVIRELLERNNWKEPEIQRELSQFFALRESVCSSNSTSWTTVEEYQRTPWHSRFRPNDASTTHFVSIECMKILEENLIPPSQRKDPYAHLRKRQYEDQFFTERFSEESARHITREELARQTKGMPEYGTMSRAKYLQFVKEYEKRNKTRDRPIRVNEIYNAWRGSVGGQSGDI